MAKGSKKFSDTTVMRAGRMPSTPEAMENEMIAASMNLAYQQLLDGTASSQIVCHFLKLGTEKARLENERLIYENELLKSKKERIDSDIRQSEMFEEAIEAMKLYSGNK